MKPRLFSVNGTDLEEISFDNEWNKYKCTMCSFTGLNYTLDKETENQWDEAHKSVCDI